MVRSGAAAGAWWPAAVIVAGVIIIVTWPAVRPATPGAARLRRGRQAALAAAARAGLDAALIGLGVLALWELRRYSAAPRLSGGTLGIDPVLVVAPAVALAGISLLPLRLLPAAARLLDGLSGRGRRLAAALASWQVSRRAVREGSPVLLVGAGRGDRHPGAGPAPELAAVPARSGGLHRRIRRHRDPARAASAQPRQRGRAGPRRPLRHGRRRGQQRVQRAGPGRHGSGPHRAAPARPVRPAAGRPVEAHHPGRRRPRAGPARPARPRAARRPRPAAAGRPPRGAVGQPVRAGRIGHRLLRSGRPAARRRPLPRAGDRAVRRGAAGLRGPGDRGGRPTRCACSASR